MDGKTGCLGILMGYMWAAVFFVMAIALFAVFPPFWFVSLGLAWIGIYPLHKTLNVVMVVEPPGEGDPLLPNAVEEEWEGIPEGEEELEEE